MLKAARFIVNGAQGGKMRLFRVHKLHKEVLSVLCYFDTGLLNIQKDQQHNLKIIFFDGGQGILK